MTIDIATEGLVGGGGGSPGATGTIVSVEPTPAQALAAAATDNGLKFTPISAIVELGSGDSMWVYLSSETLVHRWLIYDPVGGFSPQYAELSSIVAVAPNPITAAPRNKVTIMPYGGWPDGVLDVHIISGTEIVLDDIQVDRWTKLEASVNLNTDDKLFIFFTYHEANLCVVDGDGVNPLFANVTTVSDETVNPVAVILRPNAGWQSPFELKFVSGIELTSSGGVLG